MSSSIGRVNHAHRRHTRHRRSLIPQKQPPIQTDISPPVLDDVLQDDHALLCDDGWIDRHGRDFCETLRTFREALNLTIAEVAERAGISKRRWQCWEEGGLRYRPPQPATIRRIARALSVFGESVLETQLLYEGAVYAKWYERQRAKDEEASGAALHAWWVWWQAEGEELDRQRREREDKELDEAVRANLRRLWPEGHEHQQKEAA